MPIGLITNCLAVFVGGLLGTSLKKVLSEKLKTDLPAMFGLCAIGVGYFGWLYDRQPAQTGTENAALFRLVRAHPSFGRQRH